MPHAEAERLFLRVLEAETIEESEAALIDLAELDARDPSAAAMHDPIGDLYSELADECFGEEAFVEAVRLQATALEHPCTNRRREQGTLLGYRFVGLEDASALADLKTSRRGGVSDASLLSGFAEQAELVEVALGLRLHDEALEIAKGAMPPDEIIIREVQIGRLLARTDAEFPPDEDDLMAETILAELEAEADLAEAREARQLVVLRAALPAARAAWPAAFDTTGDFGEDDEYYRGLERRWQMRPHEAPKVEPYAVTVELLEPFGITELPRLVDDLPDDAVLALEASGTAPIAWPPGRNDDCWCGSGKKYKRCCR